MRWEELEERARARLGRTLRGRWTLDALLGVGGTSAVYAATHRNGAPVAIKVLHPSVTAIPAVKARFLREGYLANRVRHPAIVGVLDDDVDDDEGVAFLVMERVRGESLAERGARRLFGDEELLDVAGQALEALAVAHQAGVVHRDLKPENLLVDHEGRVRILDFGIARLLESGEDTLVGLGAVCGTPGFLAPEQARGERDAISPRTDLFNLGATLFALATGHTLFEDETMQIELLRAASEHAPRLAKVASHVSPAVAAIVDRATRFDPSDRWPSATEMLREVERVRRARGVARGALAERHADAPVSSQAKRAHAHWASLETQPVRALADSCTAIVVEDGAPSGLTPSNRRPPPAAVQRWAIVGSAALVLAVAARLVTRPSAKATDAAAAAVPTYVEATSTRSPANGVSATVATVIAPSAREKLPPVPSPCASAIAARPPIAPPPPNAAPTTRPTTNVAPPPSPSTAQRSTAELRDRSPIAVPEGYRESPY
jgi:serine/threonine-protein kinase